MVSMPSLRDLLKSGRETPVEEEGPQEYVPWRPADDGVELTDGQQRASAEIGLAELYRREDAERFATPEGQAALRRAARGFHVPGRTD